MGSFFYSDNNQGVTPDENSQKDDIKENININTPNENNLKEFESKRNFIWIDENIYNKENKSFYGYLFETNNIKCERFESLDKGFNYLIDDNNNFKNFVIIISGKLFKTFYQLINKNIISINNALKIIIFCNDKEFWINNLKMNNIYYNQYFFDSQYIINLPQDIKNIIDDKIEDKEELTFDLIENYEQLIIPTYSSYLFDKVEDYEIDYYNDYLMKNFPPDPKINDYIEKGTHKEYVAKNIGKNKIYELVSQLKDKKLHKRIILRYWLRIYTLQSEFFIKLNKLFRQKDKKMSFFYPFIKLCYEGIKNNYIKTCSQEIYRCSLITIKEFDELNKNFISRVNGFPKLIVFSRSFLSFSTDKNKALDFGGTYDNQNFYSVLYIIEKLNDIEETYTTISNAMLENISNFEDEKEALVFPFSCFEIIEIKDINEKKYKYEIHLKYLGSYKEYIEQQFEASFFDKIQITNFSEELLTNGVVKINNFISEWEQKNENEEIQVEKICFFLDGEEDFIGFINNLILIFNINSLEKKIINVHSDKIINIIKLKCNNICSIAKDKTTKIIQIDKIDNNLNYKIIQNIVLQFSPSHIIILENNDIILSNEINNNIHFYALDNRKNYQVVKSIEEKESILDMKELPNNKIIYITENKNRNKFINIINSKEKNKENTNIKIENEQNQELKLLQMIIFNNHIIIGFNFRIDIFNTIDKTINSFKYFDLELTTLINLSSDRIIVAYYDSKNNETIIREHLLKIGDSKNKTNKFDCIGEGIIEQNKINNIIKINESQIIINKEENSYIILERKNEIGNKIHLNLKEGNKNDEKNELWRSTISSFSKKNSFSINKNHNKCNSYFNENKINNKNNIRSSVTFTESNNPFYGNNYSQSQKQLLNKGYFENNYGLINQNIAKNINIYNNNINQINNINIYKNKYDNNYFNDENICLKKEKSKKDLNDFFPKANNDEIKESKTFKIPNKVSF